VVKAIQNILKYSSGEAIQVDGAEVKGKQRKFLETVELQISEYTQFAAAAAALSKLLFPGKHGILRKISFSFPVWCPKFVLLDLEFLCVSCFWCSVLRIVISFPGKNAITPRLNLVRFRFAQLD